LTVECNVLQAQCVARQWTAQDERFITGLSLNVCYEAALVWTEVMN
jgi:hypothetical protein